MRKAYLTVDEILERVDPFVGHRTGLIGRAMELPMRSGNPEICVYTSDVCNLNELGEELQYGSDDGLSLSGAGSSTSRELALVKAYCEALERYCCVSYDPARLRVATRNELGEQAMDLSLLPRGLPEEYQKAGNFFAPPDNDARLRWIQGYSLMTGEPRWLPAALVYISSPYQYPGETFSVPITTGGAIAASYEQAIISGLCEVIERDALSLTWLQQLPLPRIDYRDCTHPDFWDRLARVEQAGIEQYFFDATTDLGVSTVYALQVSRHGRLAVLVMAATKLDPVEGMIKVMDEAASSRLALEHLLEQPRRFNPEDHSTFTRLTDGAVFYGDIANIGAFDFLLTHEQRRPIREIPHLATGNPETELDLLLDLFREREMEVFAVDISLPVLREVGLFAVRVIVPQLLPLGINHNLRFLGTPRLYEAPARMGYPVRGPEAINPLPQPFA